MRHLKAYPPQVAELSSVAARQLSKPLNYLVVYTLRCWEGPSWVRAAWSLRARGLRQWLHLSLNLVHTSSAHRSRPEVDLESRRQQRQRLQSPESQLGEESCRGFSVPD